MKKFIFAAFLLGIIVALPSCKNKEEQKETIEVVADKVQTGDKISQEEYAEAIDYLESAYNDFDKMVLSKRGGTVEEAIKNNQQFEAEYPDLADIKALLDEMPEDLDDANKKRYEKLVKARDKVNAKLLPSAGGPDLKQRR